ncbi:MAG: hypothetical protein AB8H47_15085 [Bacteroidia bacterium]
MLRLVTNIPLPVHILLLVLIPLLRLPSFDGGFFLGEESFYLLAAQKLSQGGDLYTDLWTAGPPVMIWLYRIIYAVFGEASLTAIRVLSCIYIYITAVYFAGTLNQFRPFGRMIGMPAVLFVILCSIPWYGQQMSASLFVLLPMCASFFAILQLRERAPQNNFWMFYAGLWLMICTLASYKYIFIGFGLLLTYLLLKSPRLPEVLSFFLGIFVVLISFLLILFYTGSLHSYWDVGVLYYLDRIFLTDSQVYAYHSLDTVQVWVRNWGVFLLFAGIGFMHFRIRFYSYVAQLRTLELTMAVWLVSVFLILLFKYSRLELNDILLLAPPMAFYASKVFDFKWGGKYRAILIPLSLLLPAIIYLNYWGIRLPDTMATFRPKDESLFYHGGLKNLLERDTPLHRYDFGDASHSVWVMDYYPELYLSLGQHIENKYLDYRIAWYKMEALPNEDQGSFLSRIEAENDLFQEFTQHPPDFVIDPHGNFTVLQKRYPSLFGNYEPEQLGTTKVYRRLSP